MTCRACDRAEADVVGEDDEPAPGAYYVRVGVGNVRLIGCPEHVAMLVHDLRTGREARETQDGRRGADSGSGGDHAT